MIRLKRLLLVAISLVVASAGLCSPRIKDNLRLIQLANGMKVFVFPRSGAPLFSAVIYVDAGSAEERAGETGLAHLLEHMAFKGTPWIGTSDWAKEKELTARIEDVGQRLTRARQGPDPDQAAVKSLSSELERLQAEAAHLIVPNEYDQIVTREGGQEVNASTDNDYTNYYMTLPANKLELWAMMESQRLVYPAWREFYQERDVVAEERRMRSEDSPAGKLYEEFTAAAFKAHPYRNPVIGWMSDIENLTISRTARFYRDWYVPENMVAVLVGDLDVEVARGIMEKYFGTIPARKSPQQAITVEPKQRGEKRIRVSFDAQPQILMGWHKPTFPDRDMFVFEVIQYLMTSAGRSARLYERLVKTDAVCESIESFTGPGDKYPNMYCVWAFPRAPHTTSEVEKAVLEEVERLKTETVGEQELEKVRNQIDASFIKDLETNLGLAKRLGYYYIASKDPDILDKMREQMRAVTAQDVMRVAQKYLSAGNRTVAELQMNQSAGPASHSPMQADTKPTDRETSPSGNHGETGK